MIIFLIDFMLIYVGFCWILGPNMGGSRGVLLDFGSQHGGVKGVLECTFRAYVGSWG